MTVSTDSLSKTESSVVKLISSKSMEVFLRLYCLYLLLLGSIFLELTLMGTVFRTGWQEALQCSQPNLKTVPMIVLVVVGDQMGSFSIATRLLESGKIIRSKVIALSKLCELVLKGDKQTIHFLKKNAKKYAG